MRDSLSVLDQLIAGSGPRGLTYDSAVSLLGFTDGELLDATVDALAAGDGAATFRQIDKVIESGHDPRRFVEDLLERLRDLIIVAAVPEGAGQVLRGMPEDQLERMRVQQAAFGPGALSRAADIVNAGLTEMTGATAPAPAARAHLRAHPAARRRGEQGYAARLDRLERRLDVGGVPSAARGSLRRSRAAGGRPAAPVGVPRCSAVPAGAAASRAGPGPGRTVSDYTPPPSRSSVLRGGPSAVLARRRRHGWRSERDLSHALDAGQGQGRPERARPAGAVRRTVGPPSAGAPRRDAARAAAGCAAVAVPDESVGGPSVVETGVDRPATSSSQAATDAARRGCRAAGSSGGDAATPLGSAAPTGGLDTDEIRRAGRRARPHLHDAAPDLDLRVAERPGHGLRRPHSHPRHRDRRADDDLPLGNHAELVRQALIDELGVDAVVDGVHVEDISQQPAVAPRLARSRPRTLRTACSGGPTAASFHCRARQPGRRAGSPSPGGGNAAGGDAGAGGVSGPVAPAAQAGRGAMPAPGMIRAARAAKPGLRLRAVARRRRPASARLASLAPGQRRLGQSCWPRPRLGHRDCSAGIGTGSRRGPVGAAHAWCVRFARADDGFRRLGRVDIGGCPARSGCERGPRVLRRSPVGVCATRRGRWRGSWERCRRPTAPVTDDSAVSDDDEDIEQSGDVGRTVIEKVLGGRVVSETTD